MRDASIATAARPTKQSKRGRALSCDGTMRLSQGLGMHPSIDLSSGWTNWPARLSYDTVTAGGLRDRPSSCQQVQTPSTESVNDHSFDNFNYRLATYRASTVQARPGFKHHQQDPNTSKPATTESMLMRLCGMSPFCELAAVRPFARRGLISHDSLLRLHAVLNV